MSRASRTALALLVPAAALVVLVVPGWTQAAFTADQSAQAEFTAGALTPPQTTCTPHSGSPHVLTLAPGQDGVPITGYRVTMTLAEGSPGESAWQSGERDGVTLVPLGDSDWTAGTDTLGFGIELGFLDGNTYSGTASVRSLGPGSWESEPAVYDWTIVTDWGSTVAVTCDPR